MNHKRLVRAWVGLGSNMHDPARQVRQALKSLAEQPGLQLMRQSRLYSSAPWGEIDQPPFVNAVAEMQCDASPQAVMAILLDIERAQGRIRGEGSRWGPRIIDLDLLLYDDVVINETNLVLPHPHLHERAFVLLPLHELAPHLVVPGHGSIDALIAHVDTADCAVIDN